MFIHERCFNSSTDENSNINFSIWGVTTYRVFKAYIVEISPDLDVLRPLRPKNGFWNLVCFPACRLVIKTSQERMLGMSWKLKLRCLLGAQTFLNVLGENRIQVSAKSDKKKTAFFWRFGIFKKMALTIFFNDPHFWTFSITTNMRHKFHLAVIVRTGILAIYLVACFVKQNGSVIRVFQKRMIVLSSTSKRPLLGTVLHKEVPKVSKTAVLVPQKRIII